MGARCIATVYTKEKERRLMDKPVRNKDPISFRFWPVTIERIRRLAEEREITQTAYLEQLIKREADREKMSVKNP